MEIKAILLFLFSTLAHSAPGLSYPERDANIENLGFDVIHSIEASYEGLIFTNWELVAPGYGGPHAHLTPSSTYQSIRVANNTQNATITADPNYSEHISYYSSEFEHQYNPKNLEEAGFEITSFHYGCAAPTESKITMTPMECIVYYQPIDCFYAGPGPGGPVANPPITTFTYTPKSNSNDQAKMSLASDLEAGEDSGVPLACSAYNFWADPVFGQVQPILYLDNVITSVKFYD